MWMMVCYDLVGGCWVHCCMCFLWMFLFFYMLMEIMVIAYNDCGIDMCRLCICMQMSMFYVCGFVQVR